jgi:hypothetical protein
MGRSSAARLREKEKPKRRRIETFDRKSPSFIPKKHRDGAEVA